MSESLRGDSQGASSSNSLQTVDYTNNIRSWLKQINDVNNLGTDLFAFKINYNDPESATALYNGNISETLWASKSDGGIVRKYDYSYDNLNRLLEANYSKTNVINTPNNYLEKLTYDKNGNILTLIRNGNNDSNGMIPAILMDDLTYQYNSQSPNQLEMVADLSGNPQGFKDDADSNMNPDTTIDYTYDTMGNLTSDTNKNIQAITYNCQVSQGC